LLNLEEMFLDLLPQTLNQH